MTEEVSNDDVDVLKLQIIESFQEIPGIGPATAEKIADAGYLSVADIAVAPLGSFVEKTGMTKSAAEKVIAGARAKADIGKAILASDLVEKEDVKKLSTGSKAYDDLIGGGYPIGGISEIFSVNGAGKTQSCLTASVIATLPESEGGLDGDVIYIDTEGTFRAQRVAQIAEERGYDINSVLKRIHVIRANNSAHQILLVDEMKRIAKDNKVALVVVDSVICHLRSEYIGRGTLSERQQLLAKYLADLHTFAEVNNCALIVTNQVSDSPDAFFGPTIRPVGGNILGHSAMMIIQIRKGKSGKRVISLLKSPYLPNGECVVNLSSKGITD